MAYYNNYNNYNNENDDRYYQEIINIRNNNQLEDKVYEILNDENKIRMLAEKINNLENDKKEIFKKNFNDFIIKKKKLPFTYQRKVHGPDNLYRSIMFTVSYYKIIQLMNDRNTLEDRINYMLTDIQDFGDLYTKSEDCIYDSQTDSYVLRDGICKFTYEDKIQFFLSKLNEMPEAKKESALKIFYDVLGDNILKKKDKKNDQKAMLNDLINNPLANTVMKGLLTKFTNLSENDINTFVDKAKSYYNEVDTFVDKTKSYYYDNIQKDDPNSTTFNHIKKCRDRLKEIKELSKDFEYAIKNDYYNECNDIESRLNNCNDNAEEINKIIDEINNLYRNAYSRKHNKSSLSYIMDDKDENIDLLEHI